MEAVPQGTKVGFVHEFHKQGRLEIAFFKPSAHVCTGEGPLDSTLRIAVLPNR